MTLYQFLARKNLNFGNLVVFLRFWPIEPHFLQVSYKKTCILRKIRSNNRPLIHHFVQSHVKLCDAFSVFSNHSQTIAKDAKPRSVIGEVTKMCLYLLLYLALLSPHVICNQALEKIRERRSIGRSIRKTLLIFPQDYRFYYVCLEESRVC